MNKIVQFFLKESGNKTLIVNQNKITKKSCIGNRGSMTDPCERVRFRWAKSSVHSIMQQQWFVTRKKILIIFRAISWSHPHPTLFPLAQVETEKTFLSKKG